MSEEQNIQQNEELVMIPLYASEKQVHRLYGIIKMLVTIIIIMFIAFVGYVFYQSSFETVKIVTEATNEGEQQTVLNSAGELTYNGLENEANKSGEAQEGT